MWKGLGMTNGPETLRDAIKLRRGQLRINQREAARRACVPYPTWASVEQGKSTNPTARTLAGIDDGLEWSAGTAWGILHGRPSPGRDERPTGEASRSLDALAEVVTLMSAMSLDQRQVVVEVARSLAD